MKQSVNFYRGGSLPAPQVLDAAWMLRYASLVLMIFILIGSVQSYKNHELRSSVMRAEQQAFALESRLHGVQAQFAEQKLDPNLVNEVERAQKMVENLNRLLQVINGEKSERAMPFSAYFEALAKQTQKAIWLTRIQIKSAGKDIQLTGSGLSSENIPVLMQNLGNEPAFKGKTFSDFTINRSATQKNQIDFGVGTQVSRDSKNARN